VLNGQCDDSGIKISGENIFCELNCVTVGGAYCAAWHKLFVHRTEQAKDLLIDK
jgi:hypothetical protein